jgi:hypothetical protein
MKRIFFWARVLLACALFANAIQQDIFADAGFLDDEKKLKKEDLFPASIFFRTNDLQMAFGGRIREEYFYVGRSQTLREDFFDDISLFRHKASIIVGVQQGYRKYEKAASEALIKLTNYSLWRNEARWMPLSRDELKVSSLDGATIGSHQHRTLVPMTFMEDAYVKINFDTFVKQLKKHPTFFQIGFFGYQVGRGLSLGNYVEGGPSVLGWGLDEGLSSLEQSPTGMLFSFSPIKNLSVDLYYTKWREVSTNLLETNDPLRINRLGGKRPARGVDKDRESWSLKLDYNLTSKRFGNFIFEPYLLYTRAPEQTIEFAADASSKLGTYGVMVDYNHKGFHANFEIAANFGHQHVHEIDRNVVELKRDKVTGDVQEVFSHVYADNTLFPSSVTSVSGKKAPIKNIVVPVIPVTMPPTITAASGVDLLTLVNQDWNRAATRNGLAITSDAAHTVNVNIATDNGKGVRELATGPATVSAETKLFTDQRKVVNANLIGNQRIRKPYKLEYEGMMALLDASYTFEKWPLKVALAGAYIGGDSYPYNNDEGKNKDYHGFITQRDYNYVGMDVKSYGLLYGRILPRPLNISYNKFYAFNHYDDASNLKYLGASLTFFPLNKKRDKCQINTSVLAFWCVGGVNKWDKTGTPNTGNAIQDQAIIQGIRPALGIEGWESQKEASKYIGTEFNLYAEYFILENCRIYTIDGLFLPGGLYEDLRGQPNRNTRRLLPDGSVKYEGLGTKVSYGINAGIRYTF